MTKVNIYKPVTSKAVNSEQYVVCIGYQNTVASGKHMERLRQAFGRSTCLCGRTHTVKHALQLVLDFLSCYCATGPSATTKALFPISTIPQTFITELITCVEKFTKYQSDAIEENVRLYDCMRKTERQFIQEVQ